MRSARRTVPIVPGVLRYAARTWRMYSSWPRPSSFIHAHPPQLCGGRSDGPYVHGVAVVPQTAQQRFHHRAIAQEVRLLVIHQIRCNDGGMLPIALLHQLEEDVGLLRFKI